MKNNLILFFTALFLATAHFLIIKWSAWHLPAALIQKEISIVGAIDSIPQKKMHGYQFQFKTKTINNKKISTELLLAWYKNVPDINVGQTWQFIVKLKPPIGTHNPGGFDYAAYLGAKNITATGSIYSGYLIKAGDKSSISVFREKIQKNIQQAIPDSTIAAFISAVCVGLRNGLTENDWQIFQKTGTNHLVAIAGLHIGFVAGAFYFFTNRFWRLSTRLLLFLPAKMAAEIGALLGAFCYALLSGFAIPAERASIMLFCFLLGSLCYRPLSLWRRLFFAAVFIVVLDPQSVFDASFFLSFSSIAIIAWSAEQCGHKNEKNTFFLKIYHELIASFKIQFAIIIGLFPLMCFFFQQISTVSFITNAIAIPWVGFIILPVTLSACFIDILHGNQLSHFLFGIAGKLLSPLWYFLSYAAHFSFSSINLVVFHFWILLFALIGFIFLLAPRYFPLKYLGCFGVLPLFFYHPFLPQHNNFRLTVIDVGQGLSVLVQTAHHVMLYDTGAHFPGGFDFGESVVTPYLRLQDVQVIDRLEISHGDNDHSGGAEAIVNNFQVRSFFTSAPKLVSHFNAGFCHANQSWVWDGVYFTTINPAQNIAYEDNNSSCVIKIDNGITSVLLTGDIERDTEKRLVDVYGSFLHATVLIAPHHGSRTSSSEDFLTAVSPQLVVISSGKLNRYHLPAQSVLARYQAHHFRVLNTADQGAIILNSPKN